MLSVPRSESSRVVKVLMSGGDPKALDAYATASPPATSLEPLTHGGPRRWPDVLKTQAVIGRDDGPFAADVLTVPDNNPWLCQMRPSGFDFLPDGHRAAVCTWDGDVWLVDGIDEPSRGLTWQRIASGLFQPLGLKVVDGRIYVGCRDQIVCLRDLNGDGETDFYECFNSDHQVTEHFHEFAMGLQIDAEGNFYYAKAARHGLTAVVPQHGTLLRVGKGGGPTEILATGFRAPNGVCLNPDGTFFLTDQEGFWTAQEPDQLGQARGLLRQHVGLSRRDRPVRRRDGTAGLLDHQRLRPLAGRAGPGREHQPRLGAAARVPCSASRTATARSSWCRTRSSAAGCRGGCAPCRCRRSRPA